MPAKQQRDQANNRFFWKVAPPARLRGPYKDRLGINVWWNYDGGHKTEDLIIKQDKTGLAGPETLILTLGQVYDLIDALNRAVENP